MGVFVLRVLEIPEGVSDHRFELTPQWLRGQLEGVEGVAAFDEAGLAQVAATRQGREVLLVGKVAATLSVTCVRCLEEYRLPVSAKLEVLLLPGKAATGPAGEDTDDLGVERYLGGEIVLDDLLRDMILLEVPMTPSCGEDCRGWQSLAE